MREAEERCHEVRRQPKEDDIIKHDDIEMGMRGIECMCVCMCLCHKTNTTNASSHGGEYPEMIQRQQRHILTVNLKLVCHGGTTSTNRKQYLRDRTKDRTHQPPKAHHKSWKRIMLLPECASQQVSPITALFLLVSIYVSS